MGIRFYCPHCDRRLHVKEFLAGRKGICPHCDEGITIPMESSLGPDLNEAPESDHSEEPVPSRRDPQSLPSATRSEPKKGEKRARASVKTDVSASGSQGEESADFRDLPIELEVADDRLDPIDAAPHLVWYVRPPSGGQYGPAEGTIMRRWLREGRVTDDSLVWQEGWEQWRPAREVFSFPGGSATPSPPAPPGKAASQPSAKGPESRRDLSDDRPQRSSMERSASDGASEPVKIGEARERILDYRLSRNRSRGRQWAVVVVLGLVCVGLLILLGLVITGQL